MRRATSVLGPAVQSLLHGLQLNSAACASASGLTAVPILAAAVTLTYNPLQHQPRLQLSFNDVTRMFHNSSSSSNKSSKRSSNNKSQQGTHGRPQQQQQQQRLSSPPWPQPSRLVLPDRKAVAPVLGRVPPSSRAAAAATATMIEGAAAAARAKAAATNKSTAKQKHVIHVTGRLATADASAAAAGVDDKPSSASSSSAAESSGSARVAGYPWDVVSSLQQSSPYSLERMADMHIHVYLNYLRDARLGMPSVFELGVARNQGRKGRSHLLRRELLLQHYLQQLIRPAVVSVSGLGQASSGGDSELVQAAEAAAGAAGIVTDHDLQEADQDLLAAAAASAAAASVFAAGATADEVGECLMDYFVMKQCMQLMLYQRQHRRLMQQKYLQHCQQQQQQQRGSSNTSSDEVFSDADIHEVDIFDAFFDADLTDYQNYLAAAAAGEPSVFTTVNPFVDSNTLQQQQQQQVAVARQELASAAAMLSLLPAGIKSRPLIHMTDVQILQLAVDSGVAPESVIEVLEGFYRLKRLGFRQALEELIAAADDDAPLQRF